ncbi:33107_t:CDS:1, partial [Racocetra persica]
SREYSKLQTKLIQISELPVIFQSKSNNCSNNESNTSESSKIFNISTTIYEQDYSFLDALKIIIQNNQINGKQVFQM